MSSSILTPHKYWLVSKGHHIFDVPDLASLVTDPADEEATINRFINIFYYLYENDVEVTAGDTLELTGAPGQLQFTEIEEDLTWLIGPIRHARCHLPGMIRKATEPNPLILEKFSIKSIWSWFSTAPLIAPRTQLLGLLAIQVEDHLRHARREDPGSPQAGMTVDRHIFSPGVLPAKLVRAPPGMAPGPACQNPAWAGRSRPSPASA